MIVRLDAVVVRYQLIDEFTDVNPDEKTLMKLWNEHVSSYRVIPDRLVPQCCREFSEKYGAALVTRRLRNNYALHLINLYNFGLLTAEDIKTCLRVADAAARSL